MANLKYSRQRELVLHTVKNAMHHPNADWVYRQVCLQDPKISLATVYRNLNLLSDLGEIKKVAVNGHSDCFDRNTHNHYHMYCSGCGMVYDIELDYLADIDHMISSRCGFDITSHDLSFVGLCDKCKGKN
ncbi:MAG: transcriptional repressor [Ruminococcaceae bacterium]|nr:transcriptional repressor [Oscillospiraceae bacterium]